jgi:hypothetical protein
MELHDDQYAMAGLMRIFQNLFDSNKLFQVFKVKFNLYFHTLSSYYGNHIWIPTGIKEVAQVWWFTIYNVRKLLPCIA